MKMFKIRNKTTGKYYYNKKWTDNGRTYKSMSAAKKDFRKVMNSGFNRAEIEIVEFVMVEKSSKK